jgi:hypothetical protein
LWTVDAGLGGQYAGIVRECGRNVKRSMGQVVGPYPKIRVHILPTNAATK